MNCYQIEDEYYNHDKYFFKNFTLIFQVALIKMLI